MSVQSAIEWTDATWNPVTGCTEVSPGCDNCYARTFAERWRGIPGHHYEQGFDLRLWPDRLSHPLKWKKPKRIFVNSMSDLFHRDIPTTYILEVFEVMVRANWHTYQILTKRPARLLRLVPQISEVFRVGSENGTSWPTNIWLGVSIETSAYLWRVDYLRKVPAAVRFISAEPLLGSLGRLDLSGIHWVIAGGESGANARECNATWVEELRDLCNSTNVAFFFKQWGGRSHSSGGRILDGRTWDEYPFVANASDSATTWPANRQPGNSYVPSSLAPERSIQASRTN